MKFKNNSSLKKTAKWKKYGIIALVVLLVSGAAGSYHVLSRSDDDGESTTPVTTESDESVGEVPTFETEAEQQTINVPENVDPGAIQNFRLVTENSEFKIRELNGAYTITLYAIINRPDQYEQYQQQLREYKQAALQYLKNNNINTNEVKITYEPQEAQNL